MQVPSPHIRKEYDMKKILFLSALFLVPSIASAKVGFRNLEEDVKHRQICMPTAPAGTGTHGSAGVIWQGTINAVAAPASSADSATAPSTFPWPSRVGLILVDASANGTLTCTSVVLVGTDQFGKRVRETVSSITETVSYSTNVFSTISSVTGAGCAGGAEAGDLLVVRQGVHLGLTVKLGAKTDVRAACLTDASASNAVLCARYNNGGTDDLESVINMTNFTIDTSVAIWGAEGSEVAAAVSDVICLRIRPSRNMSE